MTGDRAADDAPAPVDATASVDHSAPWTGGSGQPGSAFLPPPTGFTPSGSAPFFEPGQGILWRYRRPHGSGGVRPVRVLCDDAQALVVWLAPGTEVVVAALPDGRPLRSVPAVRMFTLGRSARRTPWQGAGTLKVAPTGVPWSAWRFPSAPDPAAPDSVAGGSAGHPRWTWYVNLEDPHCRDADGILTQDHVLDVVVRPDGQLVLKDADELEAAVAAGRFSPADAARIEANAELAREAVARRDPPFDGSFDEIDDLADPPIPLPPELRGLPEMVAVEDIERVLRRARQD